jgi:GNAT superfamily N-acetyltransferase
MPAETDAIRQFQSHDAVACNRIVRACLELDPLMPPGLKEELLPAESPEIMCERANRFYVAVYLLGDTVAALGGIELNEIRLLFVAPEHQHQGIGGSLLKHLETCVPPDLFGDIFVYSAPGAVGFYRSHGYQPGGEQVFVFGSCSVPTIFMTKKLAQ